MTLNTNRTAVNNSTDSYGIKVKNIDTKQSNKRNNRKLKRQDYNMK